MELSARDRAMLDYVVKLTRTPGEVSSNDVNGLREAGFDDSGVLDVCQVAAYYAYVNRLADGLGVELEPYWTEDALTVTREELADRAGRTREASS